MFNKILDMLKKVFTDKRTYAFLLIIFFIWNVVCICDTKLPKYITDQSNTLYSSQESIQTLSKTGLKDNFSTTKGYIEYIQIYSPDLNKDISNSTITCTVSSGDLSGVSTINLDSIPEDGIIRFNFNNQIKIQDGTFSIDLKTSGESFKLMSDNDHINVTLAYTQASKYHMVYKAILCVMFVLLVASYFILFYSKIRIEKLVICSIVIFGTLISLLIPVGSSPDESSHIFTAYHYSNQMMLIKDQSDGIYLRKDDWTSFKNIGINSNDLLSMYSRFNDKVNDTSIVKSDKTYLSVKLFQYTYYPSAVGITIARLLKLSTYQLMYMGRLCNLLFFAVFVYLSIKITPVCKYAFAFAGLLPIALQQAASYSYDGVVMSLAFLLTALTIRLIHNRGLSKRNTIVLVVTSVLLFFTKQFAYFPIALIPLVYYAKQFFNKVPFSTNKKKYIIALITLLVIGFMGYLMLYIRRNSFAENSILYVVTHPYWFYCILRQTIYDNSTFYINNMLCYAMGWCCVNINGFIVTNYVVLLMFVLIDHKPSKDTLSLFYRIGFILLSSISIFGIMYAMFGWSKGTYPDSYSIIGVQGRYFLPMLPLLLICLSNKGLIVDGIKEKKMLFCSIMLNFLTVLSLIVVQI